LKWGLSQKVGDFDTDLDNQRYLMFYTLYDAEEEGWAAPIPEMGSGSK